MPYLNNAKPLRTSDVNGTLAVSGDVNFDANAIVNGTLDVAGAVNVSVGDVTIDDNVIVTNGTLTVGGAVNFDSTAIVNATITVGGLAGPAPGSVQTTDFNVNADIVNQVNCAGGNVVATLPTPSTVTGKVIRILVADSAVGKEVNVDAGANTISGVQNAYLTVVGGCSEFISDGTNYHWLKKSQVFVLRGDPSTADGTTANLTDDGNFIDWDLSAIGGNTLKGCPVYMGVKIKSASGWRTCALRTNGHTEWPSHAVLAADASNDYWGDYIVQTDSAGIIEYRFTNTMTTIELTLKGWWAWV